MSNQSTCTGDNGKRISVELKNLLDFELGSVFDGKLISKMVFRKSSFNRENVLITNNLMKIHMDSKYNYSS